MTFPALRHAPTSSSDVRGLEGRWSAEPAVLTGDLTAKPDAPEVTALTTRLRDSHRLGLGCTYPAEAPKSRIDYVLTSERPLTSVVLPTAASDHRPVLATTVLWRGR